jgi:hypothetical protein
VPKTQSQIVFSLRVEEAMYEKIKATADTNRRSINAEILVVLEKYIADFEKEHGPILSEEED